MWNWIKNAYNTAKNAVKKVVSTVKKASTIVETVNNADVSKVQTYATASSSKSAVSSSSSANWKVEYNQTTADLEKTFTI